MSGSTPSALHVAVAAVRDDAGRVLIARRPPGVHQGNLWEFPGGKLEPGEDVKAALRRELWEELHIEPTSCRPLIRIPYRYSDLHVFLDVWNVDGYIGTPVGREGQPIRWVEPEHLPSYPFPAANQPIINAVRLPSTYVITDDCEPGQEVAFLGRLRSALAQGARLVQFRVKRLEEKERLALARAVVEIAHASGAKVLLNGTFEQALSAGADGVHLSAARLRCRELPRTGNGQWLAASCHDADELALAVRLGVDFVLLSPVNFTPSHPDTPPLGWERFAELIRDIPLPVYALGGVAADDVPRAHAARGQGVAGIRGFWA